MAAFSIPQEVASLSRFILPALGTLAVYTLMNWIYRIYFDSLSHIPGPKLAAATRWYEFYYDAINAGRFYREIERMHREYGPIVRISPYEVHIDDPAFFDNLYNVTKRLDKDPWYYGWLDRNGSIFATIDSDVHKRRSNMIKRAFSTNSLSKIEPLIVKHETTFIRRLNECKKEQKLVPFSDAFRSLAVDIITDYSIPETHNLLESPDFGRAHAQFVRGITEFALWNRRFRILNRILESLPRWFVGLQGEVALKIVDELENQKVQVRKVINNKGAPISDKKHMVIMNEVYKSELPPEDKTPKRLFDEVGILIGAGSETTGHTLTTIAFHLYTNPDCLAKLKEELNSQFTAEERQEVLSYKKLENLPYLNACINEGLRLGTSVSGRFPRVNKTQPTTYIAPSKTYLIPPGTPISMTIRDMHYNPEHYPSPETFDPERWLGTRKQQSEKYFAPFSRGSRSCVGRNLANAELLMTIANLVTKFEVELVDNDRREVEIEHDSFTPFPVRDNKGLRAKIL